MRNYRHIKRDIDAMEEDALPCLQDPLCECESCLRYLALSKELDSWVAKYDPPTDPGPIPSPEDIASKIVSHHYDQRGLQYRDALIDAIAAAIQAERERR